MDYVKKEGSLKTCYVVWDFRPWDEMTKVHYFLMVQIYNLRTVEVEHDHVTFCFSELKSTPSFCFANKIPDDVTATFCKYVGEI